uniref:Uncharacterized protein n=1 Tax=Panagrolaimus sp. JU765 TaxID=591449 RepID=A0AC34PZT0_9BILA
MLNLNINKQVKNVGDHATQVIDNFESHFKNLSNGAHNIENVATYKFDDFPVNAFYAILILALIV